ATAAPLGRLPLLLEYLHPVGDHRPLHFEHLLMPETAALGAGYAEIIGKAGAADEHAALVDNHQFAMVAMQVGAPAPQVQRIIEAQLDASLDQQITVGLGQLPTAEAVETAAHLHAAGH